MKKNIYSYTLSELEEYMLLINDKKFRAKQVYEWLYKSRVSSFDEMTNLSKKLRDQLSEDFTMNILETDTKQESSDGTIKFLFKLQDDHLIESVLMKHNYGYSVCVTTQVGCKWAVPFALQL